MPLLNSFQAAIGGVGVILVYGIVIEKHYVSRATVFYNLLSFLLLLASTDIPWAVFIGLIIYLALGVVVMNFHWKRLFPVFGARTYGSLALIILLQGKKMIPGLAGRGLIETYTLLIMMWILTAIFVNFLGYLYKKYG